MLGLAVARIGPEEDRLARAHRGAAAAAAALPARTSLASRPAAGRGRDGRCATLRRGRRGRLLGGGPKAAGNREKQDDPELVSGHGEHPEA